MVTITGRMIHDAFEQTIKSARPWQELTPKRQQEYRDLAKHLNACAELCPFCQFYERPSRKIGGLCIADIPACTDCAEANQVSDITEMLLQWLEEQS
jgi:hypothetical protein